MGDTSRDDALSADPDEAAFQRLAEGLAALRRETDRLRDPSAAPAAPPSDSQALNASLAEIHRRIDALATRVNPPPDPKPVLAGLAALDEKIGTLTAGLDRFAERSALADAVTKMDGKIDTLAARLDARLNRLQEMQAERSTKAKPAMTVLREEAAADPPVRRSQATGLVLLALMLLAALVALAWLRPDLLGTERIRHEWMEPARDTVKHWLRLGEGTTIPRPVATLASAAPAASAPVAPAAPAAVITAPTEPVPAPDQHATVAPVTQQAADTPEEAKPAAAAQEASAPAAPVAADIPVAPPAGDAVDQLPAAPEPARIAPPAPHIVLGARADAWLLVRGENGPALLARILHPGETWTVPDQPGLRLTTGNAAGTLVTIDGVALPPLGGNGGVLRDIPLDSRSLAAAVAPARAANKHNQLQMPSINPDNPPADKPSATASR